MPSRDGGIGNSGKEEKGRKYLQGKKERMKTWGGGKEGTRSSKEGRDAGTRKRGGRKEGR